MTLYEPGKSTEKRNKLGREESFPVLTLLSVMTFSLRLQNYNQIPFKSGCLKPTNSVDNGEAQTTHILSSTESKCSKLLSILKNFLSSTERGTQDHSTTAFIQSRQINLKSQFMDFII